TPTSHCGLGARTRNESTSGGGKTERPGAVGRASSARACKAPRSDSAKTTKAALLTFFSALVARARTPTLPKRIDFRRRLFRLRLRGRERSISFRSHADESESLIDSGEELPELFSIALLEFRELPLLFLELVGEAHR